MAEVLLITSDEDAEKKIREHFALRDLKLHCDRDAASALMMLAVKHYPLVIVDLDGLKQSFSEIISSIRRQSKAPVFVLGSLGAESDAVQVLDEGADCYVVKPVRTGELAAKVAAALRREVMYGVGIESDRELVEARDICVDTRQRRVWVRGREKHPTKKEYELLLFLMRHPGQVYTKEELYRRVWGGEALGDMATVTVHIKKLRAMTEEKPSYPTVICTEWGVGYYFQEKEPQW